MVFITTALLTLLASTMVLAAPAAPATPAQLVEERAGAPSNFKIFAGLNPYSPKPQTFVVDVKDGNFANGTPLQLWQSYPGNPNQVFDFSQLPTIRPVGHTNLCLDAGSNPTDGSRVHLWQCYDGLPQQAWEQVSRDRFSKYLKLKNAELCLDVTDGNWANGNELQVWSCGQYNINQQFQAGSA
ncbi:Beta-agarase AgaB34 [Vanrija pseudolonga]|uniref:Beta-agarase AgaB34 n=1 Tax=Vanrija pseudolonga TaxID=143232 RepID=A0AAF1BP76_9TREE|nr:Beta-agarase AgaB34 [Vanrija pseudolonga]